MKTQNSNNMMKAMAVILMALFTACGKSGEQSVVHEQVVPQLTVVVYDVSKSSDNYGMLDTTHVSGIYAGMGRNGGGSFYGLLVKSDSRKQDPVMQQVPALSVLELKGNAYQKANRQKKNEGLLDRFEAGKPEFVSSVAGRLMLPKSERFSDVQHALELAKQILENPQYAEYEKHLLVISDMENDFPPVDGRDKMQPVQLGGDVQVSLVRPSAKANVEEMLPGVASHSFVTINDAITAIFNNPKTNTQHHE